MKKPTKSPTSDAPSRDQLDTFPNPNPQRDYTIEIVCPEFTSVCPITGQPDFGAITYTYVPDKLCVELKSLKLYLHRFRHQGVFYEAAVNQLLEDFVARLAPRQCQIVGAFTPRGGLSTKVVCEYESKKHHGAD